MYKNSFEDIAHLYDEMEALFNSLYRPSIRSKGKTQFEGNFRTPITNIVETESSFLVNVELPGVRKDDIRLDLMKDYIELKVESKHDNLTEVPHDRVSQLARSNILNNLSTNFFRRIPLNSDVDSEKTEAELKDGVLHLKLPKIGPRQKKKQIEIK